MKKIARLFIALSLTGFIVTSANAQVSVSIRIGPPALPVYEQPYCPNPGYLWMPGYWDYDDSGYYWVPGTWVLPPQTGFLWTPGYWGFTGGFYNWHRGYWGRSVGYYGGINYGYGYGGRGYYGGEWQGNTFRYNTAITRVNTTVIHNTYINKTVVNNNIIVNNNRTSYNGQGGVMAKPTRQEQVASRQPHLNPTTAQVSHRDAAKADKTQYATANHGRPPRLAEQVNVTNGVAKTQNKGVTRNAITKQDNQNNNRRNNNASKTVTTQNRTVRPTAQKMDQNVIKQKRVKPANSGKQATANRQNAAVQSQQRQQRLNANTQVQQVKQNNAVNQKRQDNLRRQQVKPVNGGAEKRPAIQSPRPQKMNVQRPQPQQREQPKVIEKDKH